MAKLIPNKYPLDLQSRKVVGVSIPFSAAAVFNVTYTTRDQIKSNLINYFLTDKGERVFNPFFGAGLRKKLFEQIDDEKQLAVFKIKIQEDLQKYFLGLKIEELSLTTFEDYNYFIINLKYSLDKFGIEDNVNITLN